MAKICMLVSEDHTAHPIIRRQIPALLKVGYEVSVLDPYGPALKSQQLSYRRIRVHSVSFRLVGNAVWIFLRRLNERALGEPWWTVIYFAQMYVTSLLYVRAAFFERADYYHAHDLQALLAAIIVGKLRKRPVIYDAHELQSEQGNPAALPNRVMRIMERRLVPLADEVIVPNRSRAKVYVSRCGLQREPTVILNCPPTVEIPRTNMIRERLGLPATTRVVLYHGTLMPGRALEELILSARGFRRDTALIVIGAQNSFFEEVLEPLRRSEKLEDRVFFLPHMGPDEVMGYVASADLGVVIYKNINLNNYLCAPTKLYEYLVARVPVVVCDFPEMRALLQEYPIGQLFDPSDPESIARAVNSFFALSKESSDAVERGIVLARERFTWEAESQKLLEVIEGGALLTRP